MHTKINKNKTKINKNKNKTKINKNKTKINKNKTKINKNKTKINKKKLKKKIKKNQIGGKLCDTSDDPYTLTGEAEIEGSSTWFLYKDENYPNIIIKKVGLSTWVDRKDIINEISATTKAGNLEVGPKVVYSTICEENVKKLGVLPVGYIVMEFINGRILNKEDIKNRQITDQINMLLTIMHENDMRHNDLHKGNIMIGNIEGQEPRVFIIDHATVDRPKTTDVALTTEDIIFEK